LLLERPLREAARIYGHRLYNVVSLCALLSMAFYIVLGVEQATLCWLLNASVRLKIDIVARMR